MVLQTRDKTLTISKNDVVIGNRIIENNFVIDVTDNFTGKSIQMALSDVMIENLIKELINLTNYAEEKED